MSSLTSWGLELGWAALRPLLGRPGAQLQARSVSVQGCPAAGVRLHHMNLVSVIGGSRTHPRAEEGAAFGLQLPIILAELPTVPAPHSRPLTLLPVLPLTPALPTEESGSIPKTIVYHLSEGVYGIFNSVLFDNTCPTPILQKVSLPQRGPVFNCVCMCVFK